MSLVSQLIHAVEYIRKTEKSTVEAIDELWPSFVFSGDEVIKLLKYAFGALVNALLVNPRRMEALKQSETIPWQEAGGAAGVTVRSLNIKLPEPVPLTPISVAIRILVDTSYDTRGNQRKAVANFELDDCSYRIEWIKATIAGHERHLAVFQYIFKQLETSGVSQVCNLSEAEQYRIAHMLDLVKKGEEPLGGPSEPPTEPVPKFGPVSQGPEGDVRRDRPRKKEKDVA
jgi:hypothetical protein